MVVSSSIIDDLTELVADFGARGETRTRELDTIQTPESAERVELSTMNGAIDVHPVEGRDVVVSAVATTRHEDDDLASVALDLTETDDVLSITAAIPQQSQGTSVDIDVGLPDSLDVSRVSTKNGEITIRAVSGDAFVETKNGNLTVDALDGVVDAHARNGMITVRDTPLRDVASKNGTITLTLAGIPVDCTVETKNGPVDIRVPADTDADFSLSTKHGLVSVEGLACLVEEETRTAVSGELGVGGPRLDVHTKNGMVTLHSR